jgi:hypothetical protein
MRRTFLLLALVLIVLGCAAPSVAVVEAPTPYPTYTPYPTLAPLATYTALPTYTPPPTYTMPPSHTPLPTYTPPPTVTVVPSNTPTHTPEPTTPPTVAPTLAPTLAPPPTAETTAEPVVSAGYPKPILLEPGEGFGMYVFGQITTFRWQWDGTLQPDEYFQVQIVSRDDQNKGEHRGIHAPTKECMVTSDRDLWGHFRDWKGAESTIHADWVVAIIKWDGVDPGKIGPTLVESEKRYIKL